MSPADIARLLPHTGSMVLLDDVIEHDAGSIHCLARSHHAPDNPLREDGRLPAWCGLEYAAQAMAVHQRLCASKEPPPARGFLAVARELSMSVADLDELPGELHIHAEKMIAEGDRSLYRFQLTSNNQPVLSGRVAVVLQGDTE
jgi:predicted hotdog family 3-hydroxylacyl-ACP dehydratase